MDPEAERRRLAQVSAIEELTRDYLMDTMVTVQLIEKNEHQLLGLLPALIPSSRVEQVLARPEWDLTAGGGRPGTITRYVAGHETVEYCRFSTEDGIEPLVMERWFHGIREDYFEISEEFRFFHNLYHDRNTDEYIKIDDQGNEIKVATLEKGRIRIRVRELRQFLAGKEMHLSLQFDYKEFSPHTERELDLPSEQENRRSKLACWSINYGEIPPAMSEKRAFSRLLGKRLIEPLPKSKSGFQGFASEQGQRSAAFIVGTDDDGSTLEAHSRPDSLSEEQRRHSQSVPYLTPIHFRRSVLDKYYQNTNKFSVENSHVRCGNLWDLVIDDHHPDRVCAWLGDLGRDLPYEEQLHWRAHNVSPVGGVSETFFRRQILGQYTPASQPEHLFLSALRNLESASEEVLGWRLLIPLEGEDEHCLRLIRVPADGGRRAFDELVLALSKILVDSLNVKRLKQCASAVGSANAVGSLSLLEAILSASEEPDWKDAVAFLRNLQKLRSTGVAHRKGRKYQQVASSLGLGSVGLKVVFTEALANATVTLQLLERCVEEGVFSES